MHIKVKAEHVQSALLFAAKKDVRYYLNGVCFQPAPNGGVLTIGTDGHTIGVFHDPDGVIEDTDSAVMERNTELEKACKTPAAEARDGSFRVLAWDGETASLELTDADRSEFRHCSGFAVKEIDGRFPDWQRCVPHIDSTTEHGTPGAFNPAFLERVAKVAKTTSLRYPWVRILSANRDSAALALTQRDDFLAVIMPMRESGGLETPEWFTGPTEEPAQAENG